MKKLLAVTLVALSSYGYGQTFTRHLEPFEELKVSRGVQANLVKSNSNELSFEIRGLSKDDIIVEQSRNSLIIKVRTKSLWETMKEENWWVKVTVPYQTLTSIEASTGAAVRASNIIESEDLYIDTSMGSIIDLAVKSNHLTVDTNMGAVTELEGSANSLNVDSNMGAVVKAFGLEAKFVRAESSMGSSVSVHCTEEFDGSASMGAEIEVKGKPHKWFENESMGGDIDQY